MENDRPRLSVVMSVYEGGESARASIESVLSQEGPDFELIVVNDGSGPQVTGMLRSLAAGDPRIRLVEQSNHGLTRSLARGCALARAPIIVRQDAGDRSLEGRFRAILAAFEATPDAVMVSSWCRVVGPGGEPLYTTKAGANPAQNREAVLDGRVGPPCHPATAFLRSAYETVGGYRPQFLVAQDIDLWVRLLDHGTFACVQDVLYEVGFSLGGISGTRQDAQRAFGEYAHACRDARLRGEAEPPPPVEGSTTPSPRARRSASARAAYFVGSCLYARRDPRAIGYLADAWRVRPWDLRAGVKTLLAATQRGRGTPSSES